MGRRLGRFSVAALVALASVVTFSAGSSGATYTIKPGKNADDKWVWKPDFRHIVKGNRIVWKNPSGKRHTVTAYRGGWSKDVTLSSGEQTAKRFKNAGSYYYRCKNHSSLADDGSCNGMCGLVHVTKS